MVLESRETPPALAPVHPFLTSSPHVAHLQHMQQAVLIVEISQVTTEADLVISQLLLNLLRSPLSTFHR